MPERPDHACMFAPGRVNLIGEHTDYNDGLALPFAIDAGVTVRGTAQPNRVIHAFARDLDERDRFGMPTIVSAEGWRGFVRGAVAELQRAGIEVPGARLQISSTLARGAGLSSSAALEVALCLTLLALAGEPTPAREPAERLALARLCSRIENEWVGARSGLLDQLAVLAGTAGHATLIDFRSLEVQLVPLELAGHRLVTVDSGEARSHAQSGYNQRRAECERACAELDLPSLRDATLAQARRLGEPLAGRVRHVVGENARVLEAVAALGRGEPAALGTLLNASHASLRDDFEVSCKPVERARETLLRAGALGARMIGGGFGGHVLALFAPGTAIPDGAREVRPGPGPRPL